MTHGQNLLAAQYRVAQYYLDYLRSAQRAYVQGSESAAYALSSFDQEREQLKQCQAWVVAHARQDDRAAAFCSDYAEASPDIFRLRLVPQEYITWLEAALMAARHLGDRRAEAAHLLELSEADERLGELHQMLDYAQQALSIARQIDNQRLVALGLNLCGLAFRMLGEFETSQTNYEQSITLYRTIGDRRGIADGLRNLGTLALQRHNYAAAQDYLEQGLVLYKKIGNQQGIASCLNDLGFLAIRLENYAAAQGYLQETLALYQAIGDRQGIASALNNLATIANNQGDFPQAQAYFEQSLAITREIGDWLVQSSNLLALGMLMMAQQDAPRARYYFEQSLASVRSLESRPLLLISLSCLAITNLDLHQEDLAIAELREGLEIACKLPAAIEHFDLYALVAAAHVWLLRGQPLQVASWLGLVENHASPIAKSELSKTVQRLRLACAAAISPEQFAAAWEMGKRLNLNAVVADILKKL